MLFTLCQKAQLAISTDLIIINKTVQENMLIQKKKKSTSKTSLVPVIKHNFTLQDNSTVIWSEVSDVILMRVVMRDVWEEKGGGIQACHRLPLKREVQSKNFSFSCLTVVFLLQR